jgi:tRNA pseudouridine38-40 synthase
VVTPGRKYKIVMVVEYDGTRYGGFQYQKGTPTIQGELELAIKKMTGEDLRVLAASRTDSGVHARGQVVSFITGCRHEPGVFLRGLNHFLPDDIAVREAYRARDDFNVRREAISREYRYEVLNSPVRLPLRRTTTFLVSQPLDLNAMACAARDLHGRHDFASFAPYVARGGTVRIVDEASVGREDELIVFNMVARSFLPHQVRNTVGVLIQIGLGKLPIDHVRYLLEARLPGLAGPRAPARGLCLMKVNYPQPLWDMS